MLLYRICDYKLLHGSNLKTYSNLGKEMYSSTLSGSGRISPLISDKIWFSSDQCIPKNISGYP